MEAFRSFSNGSRFGYAMGGREGKVYSVKSVPPIPVNDVSSIMAENHRLLIWIFAVLENY